MVWRGQKNAENAKCFATEKKEENKIKFEEYSIHNGKLSLKNKLKRQHYSHQNQTLFYMQRERETKREKSELHTKRQNQRCSSEIRKQSSTYTHTHSKYNNRKKDCHGEGETHTRNGFRETPTEKGGCSRSKNKID